jgi:hypothetical protein
VFGRDIEHANTGAANHLTRIKAALRLTKFDGYLNGGAFANTAARTRSWSRRVARPPAGAPFNWLAC